ncbi:DUF6049 family protein [Actinomadura scrupuli]|uniref:DUF6049 family protein n=1 Tax=Actinomadura scrupuli TaxID=559629 RepID=UPI003D98C259
MRVRHAFRLATAVVLMISPVLAAAPAFAEPPSSPGRSGARTSATISPRQVKDRVSRGRQAKPSVHLVITRVSPQTISPDRFVTITGTVQNLSGQSLTGASVRLYYSPRSLISRGQLAATSAPATSQMADQRRLGGPIPSGAQPQRFALKLAGRSLPPLGALGVFPLTLGVYDSAGRPLVEQRTSVVYVPKNARQSLQKTSIAWVWPVIDRPHRAADTPFLDDRLATDFAPGGRLATLAEAPAKAPKVPVTWAVDPSLLSDAATMAQKSYRVDKVKKALPPSVPAKNWLEAVKTGATSYFSVPFADPDTAALVHKKMTAQFNDAYGRRSTAEDLLGRAPTESIAWPFGGVADQPTINRLAGKDDVLLMDSTMLQPPAGLTYTPDATTSVATSRKARTALAYDATISDVISADTRTVPGSALLAGQRFLAETALMTMERTQSRTLVVAPDRRWNPGPGLAADLLKFTGTMPWLKPTGLGALVNARPKPRTLGGYPQSAQRQELDAGYLKSVKNIRTSATDFGLIFQPPKTDIARNGILRATSSAWRGRKARNTFRATLARQVSDLTTNQVYVALGKKPSRTLAGRTGTVPITVANDLPGETVTVKLRVTSRSARVLIKPTEETLTLAPRQKHPVLVQMQANGNGDTDVEVQLLTPGAQGKPIGEVHTIRVHATGLVGTALLITGGALAIVFVGVGVRATRARRRAKQAEDLDDAAAGNPGTVDGTG